MVARALEASIAGRAITINGDDFDTPDGTCVRDYIHVWDIARAHVLGADYMLKSNPIPNSGAFVFNLGTNTGTSNKEIVDYVVDNYGIRFVNFGQKRLGDPPELIADAGEANEKLDWTPQYSTISTIIDSAYKWYTR